MLWESRAGLFFSWNKFKQTPFASIRRFFMDVPMTKERGVLCLSEWWRPWFEKSEVTGIRQLFYCALGSPQPIQKSSLQKTLRDLQNDQTEEKLCCVTKNLSFYLLIFGVFQLFFHRSSWPILQRGNVPVNHRVWYEADKEIWQWLLAWSEIPFLWQNQWGV